MTKKACLKENLTYFKIVFRLVYSIIIYTLKTLSLVDLKVIFNLYSIYEVRVARFKLIINLYPRSCFFASSVNNLLTLLSRLLSIKNFFTSRFISYVLKVINSKDRKRFRSTSNTIESNISFFNYIEGFHISINYSNIIIRDLGSTLIYFKSNYKNNSAL